MNKQIIFKIINVLILLIFIFVLYFSNTRTLIKQRTYVMEDVLLALEYIKGNVELDSETFEFYDVNKDKEVNVQDVVLMNNIIKNNWQTFL